MKTYEATEQAYKNGYEAGKRDAEPVRCEACKSHDTISCPEGRVWCNQIMRYMKKDGYCSFAEMENKQISHGDCK